MNVSRLLLAPLLASPALSFAQVYPLTENTWTNPEFVSRFLGSYGFDTTVTPSITTEEKLIFEKIAPILGSNPTQAITDIKAAITPTSSAALIYTLANLHFQSNQLTEAEAAYKEAIKKFPNFLRSYKNLGIVYVQQGKYADAITMLLKTIELGGQGADVYGMLAYSYLNTGDTSSALRSYEQALFFQPNSRDWRMGKVQCLMNLNRHDDAIGMIDHLVEQFPQQKDLLMLQANAYIAKGDPKSAAATLEILRSTGGASTNALMLLGDIYLNFNQPNLALDLYKESASRQDLGADRTLRIAKRLASISAWPQLDQYIAAIDAKASAAFSEKDQLDLLNLKAQSDLAQNRTDAAAEKLAIVVQKDPLNGKALLLLADFYWKKNEIERAELNFERAEKIEADATAAMIQHARMLVSIREFKKAIPLLEKAQLIKPQTHVAQYLEKVTSASRASMR